MTVEQTLSPAEAPLVSVLITVFNGADLIAPTIKALQAQTYPHFEIVVIDDGSTDNSVEVLRELASTEPRIRLFTPGRLGRGKALNYGLRQCRGEFVAINDADDISHPDRLQKQVAFLQTHPEHGLIGTYFETLFLDTHTTKVTRHPADDWDLRRKLTVSQCLQHSTVMFRRHIAESIGGYDEQRTFLFDRDIFIRMATRTKMATVPEILVTIHGHEQQFFATSFTGRRRIIQHNLMRMKAIRLLGFPRWMLIQPLTTLTWAFLPSGLKNLTPRSLRGSVRKRVASAKSVPDNRSQG